MSTFLVYFEIKKKNLSWEKYKEEENIRDSFIIACENVLFMNEINVSFLNKKIKGYVIHDGISSGKLIEPKTHNQNINNQRKALYEFLAKRSKFVDNNRFCAFHFFDDNISEFICPDAICEHIEELFLSNPNEIERMKEEIIYKIDLEPLTEFN